MGFETTTLVDLVGSNHQEKYDPAVWFYYVSCHSTWLNIINILIHALNCTEQEQLALLRRLFLRFACG